MKQLSADQIALLKKPLPAEAVKPHPTKTFLSSIKAIYVIERLNEVFGIGSWELKSEVIDNKTAMIVVRSTLTIEEYGIELESFGGNDNGGENSKNHDTGDAYKGAVTDALTKICSFLEIGIDVFKGKSTPAPATNGHINGKANENSITQLPWLNENTKEFAGAVKKLREGKTTIDKIKLVMKLSKAVEAKLKESIQLIN